MNQENIDNLTKIFHEAEGDGYVYLIRAMGTSHIKIGHTTGSLRSRLHDLQTGNPLPLEVLLCFYSPTPEKIEKKLHREFAEYRLRGEWFVLPEKIIEACEIFARYFTEKSRVIHTSNFLKTPQVLAQSAINILSVLTLEAQSLDEIMDKMGLSTAKQRECLRITLHRLVLKREVLKIARGYYAIPPQTRQQEA